MPFTIHLPSNCEDVLREAFGPNLDRAAAEALTIEGYRTGKLSLGEVAIVLELQTTILALEWLGTRGISLNYTVDDYLADQETLDRKLGASR